MNLDSGPLAFSAITSITCLGFNISYAIPMWQRAVLGSRFPKGEIHMGAASVPMAYIAAFYLTFTAAIFTWQTAYPAMQENVNYVCVVMGGVFALAAAYWFAGGRTKYKGPVRVANDWYKPPAKDAGAAEAGSEPTVDDPQTPAPLLNKSDAASSPKAA